MGKQLSNCGVEYQCIMFDGQLEGLMNILDTVRKVIFVGLPGPFYSILPCITSTFLYYSSKSPHPSHPSHPSRGPDVKDLMLAGSSRDILGGNVSVREKVPMFSCLSWLTKLGRTFHSGMPAVLR